MERKVLIIEARFYEDIADELLKGAIAELKAQGVDYETVSVPGALEIPVALSIALDAGVINIGAFEEYDDDEEDGATGDPVYVDGKLLPDGVIALGCVIRGETSHYDIVAELSARGLMDQAIEFDIPIGNGILTVNDRDQAWARASVEGKNKGRDAAQACLRLMELKRGWLKNGTSV